MLSEDQPTSVSDQNSFDALPLQYSDLNSISLRLFYVASAQFSVDDHLTAEEQLASLRCFDLQTHRPTVAGILLFGTQPRFYLPGAYVQFLKFSHHTMTDIPDDQVEVAGDLPAVLDVIRNKILAFNRVGMKQGNDFRDQLLPDYPEWALRELFNNAVMHRDYASTSPIRFYWFSDRIEIQSPGGLFGSVTPATLTKRNSYRNPIIAEAMKAMKFVNRYGYGIQRAEALLAENGNPPLAFDIDDKVFSVTLYQKSIQS
jgi:ATP-dependent DNA helicase RecG